jgi:hypothetical protein
MMIAAQAPDADAILPEGSSQNIFHSGLETAHFVPNLS